MTKMSYDRDSVIDTAMQIVKDQHEFFENEGLDNSEHIPLIVRTAQSAGVLLARDGMPKREVEVSVDRIIIFGRRLFIGLWMTPFPGDAKMPSEEDAIKEFDQYLTPARRARFRKVRKLQNDEIRDRHCLEGIEHDQSIFRS